ncbi:hypothetical protein HK097_009544 [Rhizophlyctis rosea]|uniref:Uncharacterized protein n=1 Tax=Rhizophlyctis rosea TaxID=64517 RepID=A0AAD5S8T1_9FUNG|nr:hypothetical protein HK097_009544 [Rhizophlyctis rosea]
MLPPEIGRLIAYWSDPAISRTLRTLNRAYASTISTKDLHKAEAIWRWQYLGFFNMWCWLASNGFTDLARPLLTRTTNEQNERFLSLSAAYGHLENCEWIMKAAKPPLQYALMNAVRYGHHQIVTHLLAAGANHDSAYWYDAKLTGAGREVIRSASTVRLAALWGHAEVLKTLLDAGANLDFNGNGDVALEQIVLRGHTAAFRILHDRGVRASSAFEAACSAGHTGIVEILLQSDSHLDRPKGTALESAATNGHTEVVKILIGANVDIASHGAHTLWVAAAKGHRDIVSALLDGGVEQSDPCGGPIAAASSNGHMHILKLLLSHDTKPIPSDFDLAFQNACRNGHFDIAKLLYETHPDLDVQNSEALRLAAAAGSIDIVTWLLSHGADPSVHKSRALKDAVRVNSVEIVEVLLAAGADIKDLDDEALLDAAKWGRVE